MPTASSTSFGIASPSYPYASPATLSSDVGGLTIVLTWAATSSGSLARYSSNNDSRRSALPSHWIGFQDRLRTTNRTHASRFGYPGSVQNDAPTSVPSASVAAYNRAEPRSGASTACPRSCMRLASSPVNVQAGGSHEPRASALYARRRRRCLEHTVCEGGAKDVDGLVDSGLYDASLSP